jgi:hypothetical protein
MIAFLLSVRYIFGLRTHPGQGDAINRVGQGDAINRVGQGDAINRVSTRERICKLSRFERASIFLPICSLSN